MRTEKQDSTMLIVPTMAEQIISVFSAVVGFGMAIYFITSFGISNVFHGIFPLIIVLPATFFGLNGLFRFIGKSKIVLDKSRGIIHWHQHHYWFLPKSRTISFSDVKRILIEYRRVSSGAERRDSWRASLDTGPEKLWIDSTSRHM